jgi:hypothetical protein
MKALVRNVQLLMATMLAVAVFVSLTEIASAQCNVPQQNSVSSAAVLQQQAAQLQLNQLLAQQAAIAQPARTAVAQAFAQPVAPVFVQAPARTATATATSSTAVAPPVAIPLSVSQSVPVSAVVSSGGGCSTSRSVARSGSRQLLPRPLKSRSVARSVSVVRS